MHPDAASPALSGAPIATTASASGKKMPLVQREAEILLAGGLLNFIKNSVEA